MQQVQRDLNTALPGFRSEPDRLQIRCILFLLAAKSIYVLDPVMRKTDTGRAAERHLNDEPHSSDSFFRSRLIATGPNRITSRIRRRCVQIRKRPLRTRSIVRKAWRFLAQKSSHTLFAFITAESLIAQFKHVLDRGVPSLVERRIDSLLAQL